MITWRFLFIFLGFFGGSLSSQTNTSQHKRVFGSNEPGSGVNNISNNSGRCSLSDSSFKYSLVKADADTIWQTFSVNHIALANLYPGKYQLTIYADPEAPGPKNELLQVNFDVRQGFWQTPWFKLTAGAVLAIIIILTFRIRENQLRNKFEEQAATEIEMFNLKLEALRSKVNPHFTFNILNSIQELVLKDDRINASEHIANFGHLNRMLLENSARQMIPLYKEIKLIESYLKLEKLRLRDMLEYEINIDPGLDMMIEVPPCITLSFVENAVIHGISPKKDKGVVRINVTMFKGQVRILIEDDGIGRKNSLENKSGRANQHVSMGTQLSMTQMDLFNQRRGKGNVSITDLYDDEESPVGTRVEITYPV